LLSIARARNVALPELSTLKTGDKREIARACGDRD
jgi:hypothetical protein